MLTQLTITNFAIIEELEINFKDGLTVLTGETGAGKSIIVDALDFLLGSRASVDLIKTGTNKAQVEGSFLIPEELVFYMEQNGFDISDSNVLTVSRELTSQGSKARINGTLANVSHLLYLRGSLFDIHQQSEHIELLKLEKQLEILDGCGDELHKQLVENYKKSFDEYQSLKSKLNQNQQQSADIAKQIDFLKFEVNEIKLAKIKNLNEDNELQDKREILLNKKELIENTRLIYDLINSENQNSAAALLSQIKKLLAKSNEYDKSFEPYLETVQSTIQEIKALSSFVNNYNENFDQGENNLTEIEERLDLLYHLKKKYGDSLTKIQDYLKQVEKELNEKLEVFHGMPLQDALFKQKEKEINELAEKLTRSRENITKFFVDNVNEELQTLGFKDAGARGHSPLLVVEFVDCELCVSGKERIQFLFTSNPDEPPKPLLKVASGGELSRIMLAIKSTTSMGLINQTHTRTQAHTMVFDEIDIGVSGEVAASVAKKLYKISRFNQVLCITHQPIICAMADSHFVIEKNVKDSATQVTVREILPDERKEALAILLTPNKKLKDGVTEDAKQFAKSLLENANKIKEKDFSKV